MATVLRSLIQTALEVMEPGRFQDFCLHFLPCYADRFVGLECHGHTSGGKTRPGVPYSRPENKVSLGFGEGLNNKSRVIQRLAYGLRDEEYRIKVLTCRLPKA